MGHLRMRIVTAVKLSLLGIALVYSGVLVGCGEGSDAKQIRPLEFDDFCYVESFSGPCDDCSQQDKAHLCSFAPTFGHLAVVEIKSAPREFSIYDLAEPGVRSARDVACDPEAHGWPFTRNSYHEIEVEVREVIMGSPSTSFTLYGTRSEAYEPGELWLMSFAEISGRHFVNREGYRIQKASRECAHDQTGLVNMPSEFSELRTDIDYMLERDRLGCDDPTVTEEFLERRWFSEEGLRRLCEPPF